MFPLRRGCRTGLVMDARKRGSERCACVTATTRKFRRPRSFMLCQIKKNGRIISIRVPMSAGGPLRLHLQVSLDVHNNLRDALNSLRLSVVSCPSSVVGLPTYRGILVMASQASGMCTNVPKEPMLHLEAEFRLCSTMASAQASEIKALVGCRTD